MSEAVERPAIDRDDLSDRQRELLDAACGANLKARIDRMLAEEGLPLRVFNLQMVEVVEGAESPDLPIEWPPPGGCYCCSNGSCWCC